MSTPSSSPSPSPPSRPRAIVFAYACEPGRGSEPGAGWGVARALADHADCTVLVGPAHEPAIRRWEEDQTWSERLRFVFVPDARRMAARNIADRGRIAWFAAYLRWLGSAERVARELHATKPFDVACHASYSTYWLPTPAVSLGIPSVWGPVGGAVTTPLALWPALGFSGILGEVADLVAVRFCASLRAVRGTWTDATVRVVQNEATRNRLPESLRTGALILNHAMFVDVPPPPKANRVRARGGDVLFVGALEARKGPQLALRALALTHNVHLTIVGDGPERSALTKLAQRLGVVDRVTWLGSIPREHLFDLLDSAAAVVFTGLREEGGLALAEAMVRGAPVIVLAIGGARTIAELATDTSRVTLIEPASPEDTARRLANAMTRFVRSPSPATGPLLDQEAARRALGVAVRHALPA